MKLQLLKSLVLLGLTAGAASAAPRPVVVELFTSQACSDCPPADALLQRVQAENPDVLALDLHVTYWDGAAWTDPYSLQAATALQNDYAALEGSAQVYTPQAVVDGQQQFVGSDRDAMAAAIGQARQRIAAVTAVPVAITTQANGLLVDVGEGHGTAQIALFGFDPAETTHVLGGENGGATLSEVNVVRSITPLGSWHGQPLHLTIRPPAGKHFAVLVQQTDGTILGAGAD